ncbi:MAG: hypothetical protein JXX14_22190 [Deltaproteobacteria bacterium]|nr:hypothetical protein [Deltaproteobacteria bacterium]
MIFRVFGCSTVFMIGLMASAAALAQAPAGWDCPEQYYNNGECDCGCAVADLDCLGVTAPFCDKDRCNANSYPDWRDNTKCTLIGQDDELPANWRCSSVAWRDGYCDCGCVAFDQECESISATACDAYGDWCPEGQWPGYEDNRECIDFGEDPAIDPDWVCPSYVYNDGKCNCGCNFQEADCPDLSVHSCDDDFCYNKEDPMDIPTYPGYNNNIDCYEPGFDPELPGWECLSEYMGDGGCDCGCGVADIDCSVSNVNSCLDIHCDGSQTVLSGNLAECVDIPVDTATTDTGAVDTGTVDTATVDTGTTIITDTETGTDTDTGTIIDTNTGTAIDTATVIDTTSASDSDTVVIVDSDTADTVTTVVPDTMTDTTSQNGTDSDSASDSNTEVDTSNTADTESHIGDSATGAGDTMPNDSASGADTQIIDGKPTTYDAPTTKEKNANGSLFGCTMTPPTAAASLFDLIF